MVTTGQEHSGWHSDSETVSNCDLYFRVETVAPMVAPVTSRTCFQSSQGQRPPWIRMSSSGVMIEDEEDGKFPLPDNVHIWARYGFIDDRHVRRQSEQETEQQASVDTDLREWDQTRDPRRAIEQQAGGEVYEPTATHRRAYPTLDSVFQGRPPNVPPPTGAVDQRAVADAADRARAISGSPSPTVGSSTPPTVILTPSSQERTRPSSTGEDENGNGRASACARGGRVIDSMAEAVRTAAATRLRQQGENGLYTSEASGPGERKEEERRASRREDQFLRDAYASSRVAPATVSATIGSRDTEQPLVVLVSDGDERNALRHRPPTTTRTQAEFERHKRNRAERLRLYGCQRALYPRIVPGAAAVGVAGGGCSAETEEMETAQWVDTLRVSASIRGESLMATYSHSFAENRSAALLEERQSETRASRTADVSEMEGPDGLLHCAVLRGHHALAARAAQFLVDKRGANVNSRDAWGRTPLHTAAGKGMVAMARFFIRRGANIDAVDRDDRTPLFFACAGGNTTMARYLTRIEVGSRLDLRDNLGNLAGDYFWRTVGPGTRDEVLAILADAGLPNPPPPPRRESFRRSRSTGRSARSLSLPHARTRDESRGERRGEIQRRRSGFLRPR